MSVVRNPMFLWGAAIVIGIALAIVVLTEAVDRLKRANSPYAPVVQLVRNVVLVFLAVFFMQRMVMGLTYLSLPVRVVATAMWIFVVVVIFRLSNVVFQEGSEATWHDNIPKLFKRLPALIFAVAVFAYVMQGVWSLPLDEYVAALGLGSIAIAFALQDTISNLVSGLFIIFNRPFSEGEWIHIGAMEGRVLTVTWRYTRIETRTGDLIVIPNGSIAQGSITNHSEPLKRTRIVQSIEAAYINPPNKVKQMLVATMLETPGILTEPPPVVAVATIKAPLMEYKALYWIDDYADKPAIHNAFMTRIWYAARRFDITLSSPAIDIYHYDGPTVKQDTEVTPAKILEMLESVETFAMLPDVEVETLAHSACYHAYAQSEPITTVGAVDEGISVMISCSASIFAPDKNGAWQPVEEISPGGGFGETGLFGRAVSSVKVTAEQDVELVQIEYAAITSVINRYPQFAAAFNEFVNRRRLAVERISDVQKVAPLDGAPLSTNGSPAALHGEAK